MSDENEIEKEIQAKGLNAPRLTPAMIDESIVGECFTTGHSLQTFSRETGVGGLVASAMGCLTICVLVLRNGFTVVGKSACASPENFDAELGMKIAREDARQQIWALEGYRLRSKLAGVK